MLFNAAEFADRYSDHIVFAGAGTSAGVLSEVVHVIPLELAVLLFGALFVVVQVCVRHWITLHLHRKAARANAARLIHPRKVRGNA